MSDTTTIRGLEQGRAKFAYECVDKVKQDKKYNGHVKKILTYLKTNGLGPTVAFIFAKEGTYKGIYLDIERWLKQDEKRLIDLSGSKKLVEEIIKINSPEYRAVTIEVLAFVNWLKRFADGLIEGEGQSNA